MIRYLLDTDICIYAIKNRPETLRDRLNQEASGVATSSVTAMELFYGVEKSAAQARNRAVVSSFLARLAVLDYDLEAAAHSGDIRAALGKIGRPIGAYDLMIAGVARSRGLVLVSNNGREFARVAGLRLENWAQS